ncbi:MAG: glutaminyl-peptide cyclotransferase, partial [Kiritimatiellae bacterium]|nr:glutaminyl-peptide cyclotransferase [Kiritimatiellia bacterium]
MFELTSRSAGWVERRVFRVRQVGWILALFRGFFLAMVAVSCRQRGSSGEAPAIYTCRVVREIPHDGQAFTQGLAFENGRFYESTGLYGKSGLRVLDAETGALLGQKPLEPGYFGEGLTLFNNFLVQLTWREKTGFVYDAKTLDLLLTFSYEGEGWGLTFDGVRLIMSDGTSTLRFLDPQTFRETGCVVVRDGDAPVAGLNELEYVKGLVYANVWLSLIH